jgi:hypothetical protein
VKYSRDSLVGSAAPTTPDIEAIGLRRTVMDKSKQALRSMLKGLDYTIVDENERIWTLRSNKAPRTLVVVEVTPRRGNKRADYEIIERIYEPKGETS